MGKHSAPEERVQQKRRHRDGEGAGRERAPSAPSGPVGWPGPASGDLRIGWPQPPHGEPPH